jgi:hypothetical protein
LKNCRSAITISAIIMAFICPVKNLPIVPWASGWSYAPFSGKLNVNMVGAEQNTSP